jgi:Zn finger protein HypA/HybF involved in hydrogenase expression
LTCRTRLNYTQGTFLAGGAALVNKNQKSLDCPNCHRADSVQKVTSIIRGGTTTGTWNGHQISGYYNFGDSSISLGGGKLSGSSTGRTNLSMSLAPPEFKQAPNQAWLIIGFIMSFFLALMFLMGGIAGSPSNFIVFFIFGAFGVILVLIYKKRDNDNQAYLKEWKPKYEKALERWNNLYYCHRCDGVFLLGKLLSPVENMINYLYSEASVKTSANILYYTCPYCQSSVTTDTKFCPTCGKELYYDIGKIK